MMLEQAKEVLKIEAEAILDLIPTLNGAFTAAVDMILHCPGRVVVSGIGKSGIIGKKIAATLASTGTPAFFLHPAEGIHGDLGMVTAQDVVIAISNSGETDEVLKILPVLKRLDAKIIALTGHSQSTLAQNADLVLPVEVKREACPMGLAPTASTTAMLAMGDALAVALLTTRKFTAEDFALFHPGGALGRKLLLTVEGIMHQKEENPVVNPGERVQDALFVITAKGLGVTNVVDKEGHLLGIVTDGDIRRGLEKGRDFLDKTVGEVMTRTPKTITSDQLAAHALSLMEKNKPHPITVLPVVDADNRAIGIIHLTDLLRAGVV